MGLCGYEKGTQFDTGYYSEEKQTLRLFPQDSGSQHDHFLTIDLQNPNLSHLLSKIPLNKKDVNMLRHLPCLQK